MTARRFSRFTVFGFATTHDALAAERILRAAGVAVTPIPTPRQLGALCGIALRVAERQSASARTALSEAGTPPRSETVIEDI